jgi:hypothetical protein
MAYREELEALRVTTVPPPAPLAPTDMAADTGIPIIEHDGKSHTLH